MVWIELTLLIYNLPNIGNLVVEHILILAFRNAVTEVVDMLRKASLANSLLPVLEKWLNHVMNVAGGDHLNTNTVGLDSSGIPTGESIH